MTTDLQTVRIQNGNVYIDHDIYNKFFSGIETIALLPRKPGFFIMPVFSQASGGRLLKMRNMQGDRVVTATDFLQDCGIDYASETIAKATWDSSAAALFVDLTKE
jgi:hypothetical protein